MFFNRPATLLSLQYRAFATEIHHVKVKPLTSQILLSNISPLPGSHPKKKRVGRGGKSGGSAGRGNGGQKHHGKRPTPWFTGLYTNPIIEALPKWNWSPRELKPRYKTVNLDRIQHFIDIGRLDASEVIGMRELVQAGIFIGKVRDGVKLLCNGGAYFRTPNVKLEVSKASLPAIKTIEALGGSVTTVYHTRSGLDQLLHPDKYPVKQPFQRPLLEKDVEYYSCAENRGYLADRERYETEFRPRGYIADLEVEKQFNLEYHSVDQKMRVEGGVEDLMAELKRKRSYRLYLWNKEQAEIEQKRATQKQNWLNQKWFEGQGNFKWVEVDQESKSVSVGFEPVVTKVAAERDESERFSWSQSAQQQQQQQQQEEEAPKESESEPLRILAEADDDQEEPLKHQQ